jgi:flagellar secretion chaperone FliS
MPLPSRQSALRHYQELALSSRLESASPHEIVSLLYEELIGALDVLKVNATNRHASARASSILVSLEAGLDFEVGGKLASALASIYRSMHSELASIVRHNDQDRLARLREGIIDLFQAWRQIKG